MQTRHPQRKWIQIRTLLGGQGAGHAAGSRTFLHKALDLILSTAEWFWNTGLAIRVKMSGHSVWSSSCCATPSSSKTFPPPQSEPLHPLSSSFLFPPTTLLKTTNVSGDNLLSQLFQPPPFKKKIRVSLCIALAVWNTLCKSGWSWTRQDLPDLPGTASWVLR